MIQLDTLALIADLHSGCKFGLFPVANPPALDGGSNYVPTAFQRWLWERWRQFLDDWLPRVMRGSKSFGIAVLGDAMDGRHHGATTQISQNLDDQRRIARALLDPLRAMTDNFWLFRGTEAHGGPSCEQESTLADELEAVPSPTGERARWEMWKWLGTKDEPKTALIHLSHHIGSTGREAYEATAPGAELVSAFVSASRGRKRPPDVIVRAHRHRFVKVELGASLPEGAPITARAGAFCLVVPGWQGKTPFMFRGPLGRVSDPQFGGAVLRVSAEGELYERHYYVELDRPEPE